MTTLLLLTKDYQDYRFILDQACLPDLDIVHAPAAHCDIALGAPSMIAKELANLPNLKWVQSKLTKPQVMAR
jgi:hypothetical protein